MVIQERLVMTVPEAGTVLGISRAQAYLMVKEGRLPVIRLGRRIVVPLPALMKMLENATPTFDSKE
jgi:excisionase family DNA binding protein